VQLKFLKTILGLKSCTASYFVYGETGITPLSVDIEARTENGCMPISNKSSQICLYLIFMQKNNDSKYSNYRLIKTAFEFENYLIKTPYQFLKFIIRFRTRNHRLPIEKGSWSGIKSVERKCPLCKM